MFFGMNHFLKDLCSENRSKFDIDRVLRGGSWNNNNNNCRVANRNRNNPNNRNNNNGVRLCLPTH